MLGPTDIRLGRRQFLRLALAAPALPSVSQSRQASGSPVRYVTFDEAEPIVKSGRVMLPQNLASLGSDAMRAAWPQWVLDQDTEIRNRLQRGEEDTLANFVLFGVSFTDEPRITPDLQD